MHLFRPTLLLSLFSLLASTPSYVTNAYPTYAGTCDVSQMSTTPGSVHGTAASGTGGFSLQSTSTGSGGIKLSLSGSTGIKGVLLYIENGQNQRFGDFGTLPSGTTIKTDCPSGGTGKSVVQHTNNNVKSLPMSFTWSSSGQTSGKATVKAIVVINQNKWYAVPDLSLDLSAPAGNTTSNAQAGDSTGSTGTTTPASANHNFIVAFFMNYTLFAFVMGITIVIYLIGAILEILLKRQAVKSRKYAKTISSNYRAAE